jgi:hypothetical protein
VNLDEDFTKQELLRLVKKFEVTLIRIEERLHEVENNQSCQQLEFMAIYGDIHHQLGHIKRFRSLLN